MHIDPTVARKTLAAVRLFNGAVALVAPKILLRRLGTDPELDSSGVYPFRMFGIRTVLIGADLLLLRGEELRRARRLAVVIHGSDTLSAAIAWRKGDLPEQSGLVTTLISATNTGLALVALGERG
jgi:hypothetical protein